MITFYRIGRDLKKNNDWLKQIIEGDDKGEYPDPKLSTMMAIKEWSIENCKKPIEDIESFFWPPEKRLSKWKKLKLKKGK